MGAHSEFADVPELKAGTGSGGFDQLNQSLDRYEILDAAFFDKLFEALVLFRPFVSQLISGVRRKERVERACLLLQGVTFEETLKKRVGLETEHLRKPHVNPVEFIWVMTTYLRLQRCKTSNQRLQFSGIVRQ